MTVFRFVTSRSCKAAVQQQTTVKMFPAPSHCDCCKCRNITARSTCRNGTCHEDSAPADHPAPPPSERTRGRGEGVPECQMTDHISQFWGLSDTLHIRFLRHTYTCRCARTHACIHHTACIRRFTPHHTSTVAASMQLLIDLRRHVPR